MSVENPTPAEIRTNHERVEKAVEKLNKRAWNGTRYTAFLTEGKPGLIRRESRAYNSVVWTHDYAVRTGLYDVIGVVVGYSNKYDAPKDTMCGKVYVRGEQISELRDRVRYAKQNVSKLEEEIAELQARLAQARVAVEEREDRLEEAIRGEA